MMTIIMTKCLITLAFYGFIYRNFRDGSCDQLARPGCGSS